MLIQDSLRNLGHADVLVRHMGGDMVVLTFKDIAERDSTFNGGKMAWLRDWFIESSKWEESKNNPVARLVWLNCYGIPLHLWNVQTFSNIGLIWGDVILIADDTIKDLTFSVGKVLISTKEMELINQVVEIENKGKTSQIRVIEEQMVINTILRTDCACTGCNIERSLSNPSTAESKEQHQSREDEDDVEVNLNLEEEVAESHGFCKEVVPNVNTVVVAQNTGKRNIGNMQLVSNINNDLAAPRKPRSIELACYSDGRGTITTYGRGTVSLLNEVTNSRFLFLLGGHQLSIGIPLDLASPYNRYSNQSRVPTLPQNQVQSISITPFNDECIQTSSPPSVTDVITKEVCKPKRKQKSVEEILGIPKPSTKRKGGRRKKRKCVVFRSAIAAAALSVSTEGIINRNRILLNESQAAWTVTRIIGADYLGNDEEIMSKIMVTDEEDELRAALLAN
ncbi:hypothetical protein RHMOL_Rhmol04G0303500 [Rhododendron molle]|uniref:Uncharacterized protein n=1 Tax=Rhododendron molle TaxID=49168 RepID=A0ACC0P7L1_RHOML|nr:hypothetical protein RHMOL_Rhmol04G0303500 [Rhododendron molle]